VPSTKRASNRRADAWRGSTKAKRGVGQTR
jgi:hypothetical protein